MNTGRISTVQDNRRTPGTRTTDLPKRAADLVAAMLLSALLAPLLLVLVVLIRIKLGGPVFFRQVRPGRSGVPFELVKFRTMTDERGADGELLPDAQRLTPFGRMLRATSLDELPELWNVLKGDMSFVGPRPLLMEYLPLYSPEQSRRHEVRPGITRLGPGQWSQRHQLGAQAVARRLVCGQPQLLARPEDPRRNGLARLRQNGDQRTRRSDHRQIHGKRAMKRLAILGCGGHGKVVADTALAAGWAAVEFFDDAWPGRSSNGHWQVVGDTAELMKRAGEYDGVIVAIGDCAARWRKHRALVDWGAPLSTIVHPFAWVSPRARLGLGSVVVAGAVINVDADVGQACIVNTGATIDHDCIVGDAVHVTPGARLLGNVTVGPGSWVGAGAVIKQGTKVGAGALIGAGSVVLREVADGLTVVGNPAQTLESRKALSC